MAAKDLFITNVTVGVTPMRSHNRDIALNYSHRMDLMMGRRSLLAWNMESFPRKLVVQSLFFHTGSVIWGDFVCSAR